MMRLILLIVTALVVTCSRNVRAKEIMTNTTAATMTTTTTAAITTTTTTAATTTVQPASAYRNNWQLHDDITNTTCILFSANVTIAIKYMKKNSSLRSNFVDVVVPSEATVDTERSSCNHNLNTQVLRVNFPAVRGGQQWVLSLYFTNDTKRNGGKAFGLYQIDVHAEYNSPLFNDSAIDSEDFTSTYTNTSYSGVIGASTNHSSQCSITELQIDNDAAVHLHTFLIQAYGKTGDFLTPEVCEHDIQTSNVPIVPIVVSACLAAVVIIVLVAYLIRRGRAKRHVCCV